MALLTRGAQGTEPTAEGQRLAEGLSAAFDLIQASVEQLEARAADAVVFGVDHDVLAAAAAGGLPARRIPGRSCAST